MNLRSFAFAGAIAAGLSSVSLADVTGKVNFDGKAPTRKPIVMTGVPVCAAQHKTPVLDESVVVGKNKELANVVISLKNPPAGGKVPEKAAVLDQKGCQYSPHVLAIMVGQKVLAKNSDAFLHNVHGLPENNPGFNFGQNNIDNGKPVPAMREPEYFRVKCDVHPWMSAWFAVFNHPYFGVSKEDGTFAIAGIPDGEYDVVAWHEKLGEQEGKVSVKGGKGEVNFTFKLEEEANASPVDAPVKAVVLSASGKTSECSECCEKEAVEAKQAVAQTAAPVKK